MLLVVIVPFVCFQPIFSAFFALFVEHCSLSCYFFQSLFYILRPIFVPYFMSNPTSVLNKTNLIITYVLHRALLIYVRRKVEEVVVVVRDLCILTLQKVKLLYLLHLSLGDRLSLKTSISSALAGVPSSPLTSLACRMGEAVEQGHFLRQTERGKVWLLWDTFLAIYLHLCSGSLSWFLVLLAFLVLLLDC